MQQFLIKGKDGKEETWSYEELAKAKEGIDIDAYIVRQKEKGNLKVVDDTVSEPGKQPDPQETVADAPADQKDTELASETGSSESLDVAAEVDIPEVDVVQRDEDFWGESGYNAEDFARQSNGQWTDVNGASAPKEVTDQLIKEKYFNEVGKEAIHGALTGETIEDDVEAAKLFELEPEIITEFLQAAYPDFTFEEGENFYKPITHEGDDRRWNLQKGFSKDQRKGKQKMLLPLLHLMAKHLQ